MKKIRDRITSLRNEGLAGRIALAFIGVSLALSVLYGIGASSVIYYLLKENEVISTKRQMESAARKTETALLTLNSTVESLSANSIFINGLVDTYGRDSYLILFLKSSRLPVDIPHRLSLCNFKGEVIASSEGSAGSYAGEAALVKELVESARPAARLLGGGARILICYPVIYPAVGTAEGFLALEFQVRDLMAKLGITNDAAIKGFQLFSATNRIWQVGAAEGTGHVRQLVFSNALASLKLSLQVWMPRNPALLWFAVIFVVTLLLSLYISIKMAFRVSGRLASRLVALDKAAADVAASGTPQGEIDSTGTDEIARVSASFNSMIRRLKDSYQLLESRVEEKTSQLQQANRELEAENTLRRELVEKLESSNARYDELVRRIAVGIYVFRIGSDGTRRFEYANPRFFEIISLDEEALLRDASLFTASVHPEDIAGLMSNQQLAAKNLTPFQWEGRFLAGDSIRWLHMASEPTLLPGGDSIWNGVLTDITERRQAIEATHELLQMLESIPNGIVVHDAEGRLLYANQRIFDLHGYGRDELPALNLHRLSTSATEKRIEGRMQEIIKRGEASFEVDHLKKDGTILPLWVNVKKATWAGKDVFLSVETDITERKQAEEEKQSLQERLQRAEKMEALGQLAGGVSHDLNNILGVLSGYSELLLERLPEGSPLRQYAANIFKSSAKGAAIIQDLLTLARRGVVVTKIVDLNTIVSGLLVTPEFGTLQYYHPEVSFQTEQAKELLNIKGSPVHLEKTVLNLVSNAAEAIVGTGEVVITTELCYLDKSVRRYDNVEEGDYVVLKVSDSGKGIPAADLDKIFEPFYSKKKMGRSGTGLGLAIVWGTVKDHGGYIDVQSREGEGTIFTLYFPMTREKLEDEDHKLPIEQYMGLGESALLVDDVPEQREVATTLLKRLGYQVNAVASGEEALAYLRSNRADILVLDMIMPPGIDGLETYRKILEINPRQKAILVSGFSETDRVQEAQKIGAGAYVKKPYLMENIGVAIRDELVKK